MFVPVASGVLVATSRVMATTSTLVVRDGRGLLVDPAWQPDELDALAADVAALGVRVTSGLATHAHHDHLLWHPGLGDVPRWASATTAALAGRRRTELLASLTDPAPDQGHLDRPYPPQVLDLVGRLRALPGTAGPIPVPDPFDGLAEDVLALVHDAHVPGHTALWLPERRVLVAGDMCSDVELPVPFDPDDVPAYLAGLDVLAPYAARATMLVPGHGLPSAAPMSRVDADRRYLDAVLAGREPVDPRLDDPAMRAVHERIVALVAG